MFIRGLGMLILVRCCVVVWMMVEREELGMCFSVEC